MVASVVWISSPTDGPSGSVIGKTLHQEWLPTCICLNDDSRFFLDNVGKQILEHSFYPLPEHFYPLLYRGKGKEKINYVYTDTS